VEFGLKLSAEAGAEAHYLQRRKPKFLMDRIYKIYKIYKIPQSCQSCKSCRPPKKLSGS
jgi:hypothetical protein